MTLTDPARTNIRRARPDEASALTELAMRSKARWGYDAEFMAACRPLLTLSPVYFIAHSVYMLEAANRVVGFYALTDMRDGSMEIDMLFVEPDALGNGFGTPLWQHAFANARRLGFRRLSVESDPNATGFYARMGMTRFAERKSTVEVGRMLPLLRIDLD
jgi:GNAT superfamily N-acetyltransferase